MNECDHCSEDCLNLEECISARYNAMLARCHVDILPAPETSPEAPRNAKERTPEEITRERYGEGVGFERIRRITGYLVGDVSRWNNAKYSELHDRVKHG